MKRFSFCSPTTTGQLVGIYAFHLLLLCTLWPVALVEYDKKRVPWRLFLPALLVGSVAPLVWPFLRPPGARFFDIVGPAAVGLVFGEMVGWLLPCDPSPPCKENVASAEPVAAHRPKVSAVQLGLWNRAAHGIMFSLMCVSLFLGYTAVLLLGAVVFFLTFLGRTVHGSRSSLPMVGPVIWLVVLVPLWLVFWRQLTVTCPGIL
jgi:hypothetical protein